MCCLEDLEEPLSARLLIAKPGVLIKEYRSRDKKDPGLNPGSAMKP